MNKIVIGEDTYYDAAIYEGNVVLVESITGDELQYDSINFTVDHAEEFKFVPLNSDGLMTADGLDFVASNTPPGWEYGEPIYYYHNDELLGKFYIESVKRVGKTAYSFTGISGVGLLANSQHYGGIYFGIKMTELVNEIIGGKIKYSIDPMIANQPLYGWLPIATRRENLHQVLFAMSASVKKDDSGEIYISTLSKDTAKELPDSSIYEGGSIEYPQAFTKVALSEHTYIKRTDDETVTLYDGEISADSITTPSGSVVSGGLILFDEPAHSLVATGTTVIESGVNYAVISPSAECQLVGQKYTHTVRQITRPETAEGEKETENKIVISDATLVSVANSENVAERLSDYYDTAKTITMDIVVNSERAGDSVAFNDPFDETTTGIISSMDISMSNVLKATAEVIADYSPPSAGNYYNNVAVITGDGTWQVPAGVEKIRIVLIGGGQGGWSGNKGENGSGSARSDINYDLPGGAGGTPGNGGKGGKVYILTVEVVEGSVLPITVGTGGEGGVCTSAGAGEGAEGTASALGEYSSDNGTVSSIGYVEIFSGVCYAATGDVGLYSGAAGGRGSTSSSVAYAGEDLTIDGVTYKGGSGGVYSRKTNSSGTQTRYYYPGGGGGAAAGGDGSSSTGSAGADGANATIAGGITTLAGQGGIGGNGGGGGGGGGLARADGDSAGASWTRQQSPGSGGLGSNGGRGADGCVIIYY